MGSDYESSQVSRLQLEDAARRLGQVDALRHERLEAMATLLSAYSLGSRTATRALEEHGAKYPSWRMPSRQESMAMAHDAFRESEALRAAHNAGDTLPGFR